MKTWNMEQQRRIILLEDDGPLLMAIQRLLEQQGYSVFGFEYANDFLSFVDNETYLTDAPWCAIIDVDLPDINGLDVQQHLRDHFWPWPIIFISGAADSPTIIKAWRNGAIDFLLKPFEITELLQRLENVFRTPSVEAPVADSHQDFFHQQFMQLTPRERQVLSLVAEGNTNLLISQLLDLSLRTVKMHRSNLMQKLGYKHVADLVRFYETCRRWL